MNSIDIGEAKRIVARILNKEIESMTLDTLSEIWSKWDAPPVFVRVESNELRVKCTLYYETHGKTSSAYWDSYFMASLDAILLIQLKINNKEHKK